MSVFAGKRVIRSEVEGRRDVGREREYQRRYANRHGYFWLPCPLCGEEFGGHEMHGFIPTGEEGRSTGICPRCTGERQWAAEERLAALGESVSYSTSRWGRDGWCSHRIPHESS